MGEGGGNFMFETLRKQKGSKLTFSYFTYTGCVFTNIFFKFHQHFAEKTIYAINQYTFR